jgi:cadmium resistance protein CadD (predicted permease)
MWPAVLQLISKVIITFILTNFQDIVILITFFLEASEEDSLLKVDHVVLGQYLGFSTLLMLSLIGYTVSYFLPVKLFGFLGFLIIYFGLHGLYKAIKDLLKKRKKRKESIVAVVEGERVVMIQLEKVNICYIY